MSLIAELRRRNIFSVAALYVVSGWLVLQLTDVAITLIGGGDWIYRFFFGMGVICFPLILIFSYIYEITPGGLRKEHMVERADSITGRTGRIIHKAIVVITGLALALELGRWLTG